jgi:hypothetical protein
MPNSKTHAAHKRKIAKFNILHPEGRKKFAKAKAIKRNNKRIAEMVLRHLTRK